MTISCLNILPSVLDIKKTKQKKKTSFLLHYNSHVPSCPDTGLSCFNISIKNETVSRLFRSIQFLFFYEDKDAGMDSILGCLTFILEYRIFVLKLFWDI